MDECRNEPCDLGAQCTNIPGGYRCSCPPGFERNPLYPASLLGSHPGLNFQTASQTTPALTTTIASDFAVPTSGSNMLINNNNTQTLATNRIACLDINECASSTSSLSTNQNFINNNMSLSAAAAATNSRLSLGSLCGQNAQCVNTPGGYFCECPNGYAGNPKVACTDIDECEARSCGPNSQCKNTPGSYKCECKPGFKGKLIRMTPRYKGTESLELAVEISLKIFLTRVGWRERKLRPPSCGAAKREGPRSHWTPD